MTDERDPVESHAPSDEAPSNVLVLRPRRKPAPPPQDDDPWPPGAA